MTYEEAKEKVKKYTSQVLNTPLINFYGEKVKEQHVTHVIIAQFSFLKEAIMKMESELITNEQAILCFTHLKDDFDVFVVSKTSVGDCGMYHNILEVHLKKMGILEQD